MVATIMKKFHFLVMGGRDVGKSTFIKSYAGIPQSERLEESTEKMIEVPEDAVIVMHR